MLNIPKYRNNYYDNVSKGYGPDTVFIQNVYLGCFFKYIFNSPMPKESYVVYEWLLEDLNKQYLSWSWNRLN